MILIVDYKAGNLTSVKRALDHLELPCRIVSQGRDLDGAERIIFPGVGHAAAAMAVLRERGFDVALRQAFEAGVPILGICVGAQIVLSRSEEGPTPCLGLIEGHCPRFQFADRSLKVPHMGWNEIKVTRGHFVLQDVRPGDEFYFVHSYYPQPQAAQHVLAECEYGINFPAVLGRKNLVAVQFHPEKSGPVGLQLLRRFARWDGKEAGTC